jgi:hypothetical protein
MAFLKLFKKEMISPAMLTVVYGSVSTGNAMAYIDTKWHLAVFYAEMQSVPESYVFNNDQGRTDDRTALLRSTEVSNDGQMYSAISKLVAWS